MYYIWTNRKLIFKELIGLSNDSRILFKQKLALGGILEDN